MSSRRIPGLFPPVGSSPVADRIRARRGPRGLIPLDGALLHVPPVADGWSSLLTAVRTQGNLPADVRELMILRVAAHNYCVAEWVAHEAIARGLGITLPALSVVRDIATAAPPISSPDPLTAIQAAAIAFADASTKDVTVPDAVFQGLSEELKAATDGSGDAKDAKVQSLLVEAAAVVATYNMVTRFLLSLDVSGLSGEPVPYPA